MEGYIQIYEQKCVKSQIPPITTIITLIAEQKQHLKSSEIVKTIDGLVSTLVIGTYVIPMETIKHISEQEANKILTAYVVNGIMTIIGYTDVNDNDDEIIYCNQLGENTTLNINPMAVEIVKKKNGHRHISKKLI
jgi:hypothetical protein